MSVRDRHFNITRLITIPNDMDILDLTFKFALQHVFSDSPGREHHRIDRLNRTWFPGNDVVGFDRVVINFPNSGEGCQRAALFLRSVPSMCARRVSAFRNRHA